MARQVPLFDTASMPHESFKVRLRLLTLPDRGIREDWCDDPARPGVYSVLVSGMKGYTQFNFSDEQTAFEFKMRWG